MVMMQPRADAPGEAIAAAAAQNAVRESYMRLASRKSAKAETDPNNAAGILTTAVVEPIVLEKRAMIQATMGGLLK